MNALLKTPPEEQGSPLIFNMEPSALAGVPFHTNTANIVRYFSKQFPLHLAVHEVSPVLYPPADYTAPHLHDDCDEINIIISSDELVYKIVLGEEEFTVTNNACIWIPAGLLHSANVLSGAGFFVAVRLEKGRS
ncbi:hypothetical protein [Spirosoma fluviale]|uniref:Cupin domain-containing protein n=1 Tax=Spirosoma fluviale TaxID=1597977 RepID=A0A286GUJ9_9BACT|nr:hypothetical protein [Spirosoma fluviale]SOD99152.1 hypothetical protein SAMN06269250_6294 [Spirosoma fluviale]